MTFSIVARDASGALGMAVSSSSPAVAARCLHLRGGVGAVGSQNITDPRYGTALLDALEGGAAPDRALADLMAADETGEYRQVAVVDATGRVAVHSGAHTLGTHATATGDGVVTTGNLLASTEVPAAMLAAFEAAGGDLERRLLAAMQAGLAAGGEAGQVRSAGLAVVRDAGWNETDLRVDWHDDPIGELAALLELWLLQRDDYVTRGIHPSTAPAYGVPGDE
ncbi:DUF1028 domain-containing protein [Microbacterium sp.]|uniref:DUF1028 domain-containing protein n=1 Tax=Microbacterium sp. TaxID=51671 RepID=UPI003A8FFD86